MALRERAEEASASPRRSRHQYLIGIEGSQWFCSHWLLASFCCPACSARAPPYPSGSMFHPNGVALDIFGDKATSDARRRCQPAEGDESARVLMDLHLATAIMYAYAYDALLHRPGCAEPITLMMDEIGCPLSLAAVAEGDPEPSTDTPWGLAKACVDETYSFLNEHDGWNSDGGMGGKEFNRIPFSGDFSFTDSAGNE